MSLPNPELRALPEESDVIIIGGGNAGLCAALTAASRAEKVILIERAPLEFRGGNSKYTRDLRCAHDRNPYTTGIYSEDEFFDDILRVTECETSKELARLVVRESSSLPGWMAEHGARWQRPLKGALHLSRTNMFFLGGGKALLNAYYDRAMRLGVRIVYNALVEDLLFEGDRCVGVRVDQAGHIVELRSRSVVVSSGGFEANLDWLREYWGSAAENFIIRGTTNNDGRLLRRLLASGARAVGNPRHAHMIAVDARSPKYDSGIVTRVDSIPFGIVVNRRCKRFYDEGEEEWPKRYAIWGRLIAEQEAQIAYSIFDSKTVGRFIPPAYEPYSADSLGGLAKSLQIDPGDLVKEVGRFNDHIAKDGKFNPGALDDCRTSGLDPPKSHWALPVDTPPYYAFPLRPGLTFTYMGVGVDSGARIIRNDGGRFKNLFAAGEIMMGNILTRGYLGGIGLTIGSVFGRIAGEGATK